MLAYLKVCPKLRFLKLSMVAESCESMRTSSFLLAGFFRVMNEWLRRFAIREVGLQVETDPNSRSMLQGRSQGHGVRVDLWAG